MAALRGLRHLYVQVLIAIVLGVAVGAIWPDVGEIAEADEILPV